MSQSVHIPCGRFAYSLQLRSDSPVACFDRRKLPGDAARLDSPDSIVPDQIGDGVAAVVLTTPPDQTAVQPDEPELPTARVRIALVWLAPDARDAERAASVRPAQTIAVISEMLEHDQAVSSAIEGLGELAMANGLQIQASVIELAAAGVGETGGLDDETLERILPKRFHAALAEERERESRLAYVQVCTAGLPPLIHAHSAGIIFPVRSWVPAGLYPEWQPLCQSIECEVGDRLVVHTELAARPEQLKTFHSSLPGPADEIDWSLFAASDSSLNESGPARSGEHVSLLLQIVAGQ